MKGLNSAAKTFEPPAMGKRQGRFAAGALGHDATDEPVAAAAAGAGVDRIAAIQEDRFRSRAIIGPDVGKGALDGYGVSPTAAGRQL